MWVHKGINALSDFRAKNLLAQLQAVDTAIHGVSAEFVHFVDSDTELSPRNAAGAVIDVGAYTGTTNTYSGMSNKNSTAYDSIILAKAEKYGVNAGLIKAIMHQESKFNPRAVSPVGARGLMQLMPKWHPNVKDYFDPEQNIDRGAQYIAELYGMKSITKGQMRLVIAAYNAGQGAVKKYGDVPPFTETQEYVRKVTNYYNTLYKAGLDSNPATANYQAVEKLVDSLKKLGIKHVDGELVYDEEEAGYRYLK
jgi:hypothetical protein